MERISWIDYAKAIGIYFVVLGHLSLPQIGSDFIYSFHMPLFFLLAGITFKTSYDTITFLRKKFHALIVPYFCFSLILFTYWFLAGRHYGADVASGTSTTVLQAIQHIFYGISNDIYPSPLWFLTCLFVCEILFYFILKQKSVILIISEIGILLTAGLTLQILGTEYCPRLIWNIDLVCYYLPFVALGYVLQKKDFFQFIFKTKWSHGFSFLICALIFLGSFYASCVYQVAPFKNFIDIAPAITGSLVVIQIAKLIPSNKLLSFWGKNTLTLFGLHTIALGFIKAFIVFVLHYDLSIISNCVAINAGISLIALFLLMPVALLFRRFAPWAIGQKTSL